MWLKSEDLFTNRQDKLATSYFFLFILDLYYLKIFICEFLKSFKALKLLALMTSNRAERLTRWTLKAISGSKCLGVFFCHFLPRAPRLNITDSGRRAQVLAKLSSNRVRAKIELFFVHLGWRACASCFSTAGDEHSFKTKQLVFSREIKKRKNYWTTNKIAIKMLQKPVISDPKTTSPMMFSILDVHTLSLRHEHNNCINTIIVL